MNDPLKILIGDATEKLRELASGSVHCIITSPPYFGLRSYIKEGDPLKAMELGQERTPEEYTAKLVAVFREARRVLRDDGTLFLNLGDSYFSNPGNGRGGGSTLSGGKPHLSSAERATSYGTSDKGLVNSSTNGCLCESLCGVCRVVFRRTVHTDPLLFSMLRASLHAPSRERKELQTVRLPTSDCDAPEVRNAIAMPHRGETSNRACELLYAWQESMPNELTPQLLVECWQRASYGECLLCARSLLNLRKECAGKTACNCGIDKPLGASFFRTSDKSSLDSAYPHLTTKSFAGQLKPKDLVGIPWMVAFALRADGWYLRQWMPWVKRNSMPESVTDRPASSCETIFLLTKGADYYYDHVAVRKPPSPGLLRQVEEGYRGESTKDFFGAQAQDAGGTKGRIIAGMRKRVEKQRGHERTHEGFRDAWDGLSKEEQMACGSNRRNGDWFLESWNGMLGDEDGNPLALVVNASAYRGSHYATFPKNLVKPMVLAGTSEKGCCASCGAPIERETETEPAQSTACPKTQAAHEARGGSGTPVGTVGKSGGGRIPGHTVTVGWRQTCGCPAAVPVPCTVLDVFGGSGTTAAVAIEYGRMAILIDLDPNCKPLMEQRCDTTPGLPLG